MGCLLEERQKLSSSTHVVASQHEIPLTDWSCNSPLFQAKCSPKEAEINSEKSQTVSRCPLRAVTSPCSLVQKSRERIVYEKFKSLTSQTIKGELLPTWWLRLIAMSLMCFSEENYSELFKTWAYCLVYNKD